MLYTAGVRPDFAWLCDSARTPHGKHMRVGTGGGNYFSALSTCSAANDSWLEESCLWSPCSSGSGAS